MDTNKSEQELYQIYFDGNDYCAELIDGSWRVVVPDSELFNCGKEFDQKPERFVKSELLTLDEIYDRDLQELVIDFYEPGSILEGTTTILEAVIRLMDEAKHLVSLMDHGCDFDDTTEDGLTTLFYYLRPYHPENHPNKNS